jgi:hypothetical protein
MMAQPAQARDINTLTLQLFLSTKPELQVTDECRGFAMVQDACRCSPDHLQINRAKHLG